ncbi:glycohydrolase toxin TNT-related protein [Microbulbifer sp. SH-1]|uniref:TNT domain-containing protein n=1 Tax=Microbulbifer sp. SH-1 TaxID=2681547 RepID=UPI00140BB41F|nr:glycohydrolase toxin TNT-related protein [Microbulbifer sp. SH-1]
MTLPLPPATRSKPYTAYEILKPLDVESAETIPWFGMQGNGTQYELPDNIDILVSDCYLKPVTPQFDPSKL